MIKVKAKRIPGNEVDHEKHDTGAYYGSMRWSILWQ